MAFSLDDYDDVYIRADGYYQLECAGFVACYPSGEMAGLVVTRHILVKLPALCRDHCGGGGWLETSQVQVWHDLEVWDVAELREYDC